MHIYVYAYIFAKLACTKPRPKPHRKSMGYIEKKFLDAYKSPPSSIVELHARVIEQWYQMPPEFCSRLFESVLKLVLELLSKQMAYGQNIKV